jgi:hypothetical protein
MRNAGRLLLAFAAAFLTADATGAQAAATYTEAQVSPTVLQPGLPGTNLVVLRRPPQNPKSHIGIFVMHASGGQANSDACVALAARGYSTLCADTAFGGRDREYKGYEDHAPAISAGVNHLRTKVPGITRVAIFGRSMGAPMMAFYANASENGAGPCSSPQRILPCDRTNLVDAQGRNRLAPVDALILDDPHLGDALASFTYMDPAITNPALPGLRDPQLDMFSAANGYPGDEQAEAPHFKGAKYSEAFRQRFFAAQAARNAAVLKQAQDLLAKVKTGAPSVYPDGALITIPGAAAARLWQADLELLKCTKRAHTFLTRDGRKDVSPGPVCSVRIPSASFEAANSVESIYHVPVNVWLGAHALRTNGPYRQTINDITGIDYESSNTSSVANLKTFTKPLLLVAHSAHYFLTTTETIFDNAKSADKTFAITEGATHGGDGCGPCAQAMGLPRDHFGDAAARTYDFMDEWLDKRF